MGAFDQERILRIIESFIKDKKDQDYIDLCKANQVEYVSNLLSSRGERKDKILAIPVAGDRLYFAVMPTEADLTPGALRLWVVLVENGAAVGGLAINVAPETVAEVAECIISQALQKGYEINGLSRK